MPGNVEHGPTGDWAVDAADRIEHVVGTVRSKTADPLIAAARWLVYGTLAAIVGLVALALVAIALIRGVDIALDKSFDHDRSVWLADAIVGGIFTLAGLFLWSRRRARDADR